MNSTVFCIEYHLNNMMLVSPFVQPASYNLLETKPAAQKYALEKLRMQYNPAGYQYSRVW